MAAQVEAFDFGTQNRCVVESFELKFAATSHADEFAAWGVGITVTYEEYSIFFVIENIGRHSPRGGFFDEHAARENVDAGFGHIFSGLNVTTREWEYVELLENFTTEVYLFSFL